MFRFRIGVLSGFIMKIHGAIELHVYLYFDITEEGGNGYTKMHRQNYIITMNAV
jgi:hypothetical protein